jgi:hypothetical protein
MLRQVLIDGMIFRKWPRFAARVLVEVKFNCKRPSGRSFLSTFLSTSN